MNSVRVLSHAAEHNGVKDTVHAGHPLYYSTPITRVQLPIRACRNQIMTPVGPLAMALLLCCASRCTAQMVSGAAGE